MTSNIQGVVDIVTDRKEFHIWTKAFCQRVKGVKNTFLFFLRLTAFARNVRILCDQSRHLSSFEFSRSVCDSPCEYGLVSMGEKLAGTCLRVFPCA